MNNLHYVQVIQKKMRLITKYLGPCTQAPHTDVSAKSADTWVCTPQILLN